MRQVEDEALAEVGATELEKMEEQLRLKREMMALHRSEPVVDVDKPPS